MWLSYSLFLLECYGTLVWTMFEWKETLYDGN